MLFPYVGTQQNPQFQNIIQTMFVIRVTCYALRSMQIAEVSSQTFKNLNPAKSFEDIFGMYKCNFQAEGLNYLFKKIKSSIKMVFSFL